MRYYIHGLQCDSARLESAVELLADYEARSKSQLPDVLALIQRRQSCPDSYKASADDNGLGSG